MRISDWSSDVCSSDLVQAHDLGGAQRSAALLGGDLDGTRSAAAMQVRAKLAGTSRTLHRCHHFAADHETTDVAALRLAHEFLHQKIGIEPAKCFNHRRCGVDRKSTRLNSSH